MPKKTVKPEDDFTDEDLSDEDNDAPKKAAKGKKAGAGAKRAAAGDPAAKAAKPKKAKPPPPPKERMVDEHGWTLDPPSLMYKWVPARLRSLHALLCTWGMRMHGEGAAGYLGANVHGLFPRHIFPSLPVSMPVSLVPLSCLTTSWAIVRPRSCTCYMQEAPIQPLHAHS